jgi:RND superfamily putative drug exporter
MILVPATMALLGNANWWLPAWLDRALPRLTVEGAHADDEGRESAHDATDGDASPIAPERVELVAR